MSVHPTLFERGCQITLKQWSSTWSTRSQLLKAEMLLVVQCCVVVPAREKSDILHSDAGRGVLAVFASRPVRYGSITRYHFGPLVYDDLSFGYSRFKRYGESIVQATRELFLKLTIRPPETARGENISQHPVWIVPVPFFAMRYVNHWSYLKGNESPESEKLQRDRKNNAEF